VQEHLGEAFQFLQRAFDNFSFPYLKVVYDKPWQQAYSGTVPPLSKAH